MKFLFVSLLLSSLCFSQQFPFGVFANSGGPTSNRGSNYPQMNAMGINYIIDVTRNRQPNEFSSINNIIALNAAQLDDFIYLYTKGMLMDWNNTNKSSNNIVPGFRYVSAEDSGEYIIGPDPINGQPGILIKGPYYFQYQKYKSNSGPYSDDSITYHSELTVKIDGSTSGTDKVFTVKVEYNLNGTSYPCLDEISFTAGELSNNDTILTLPVYNLMKVPSFTSLNYSPLSNLNNNNNGIVFTINWKGNRKLYIKNLKIYDDEIGKKILYDSTFNSDIISEVDSNSSISNLKYFYSFDEPHSIDNYKPYKIVDDIVKSYTSDSLSLITAIYPEWNGFRDFEVTLPRFITEAQPKTLFFWYYPFWDEPEYTLSNLGYKYLIEVLNLHYTHGIRDFWIAPQAGGFWEKDWTRREITANELRGQSMIALAYGAKGLIYYQYYSQKNNDGITYRVTGLVDVWNGNEFPETDKYYMAQDIAERLNGPLGKTLLSLKYQGEYSWLRRNQIDYNNTANNISFFNLISSNDSNEVEQKHAGYLKDTTNGIDYILTTNLDSSLSKSIHFNVRNTNYRNYKNIGIKNIEGDFIGGFDGTYENNHSRFIINNVPASDGLLLRIAPMLRYGGEIVTNDTTPSVDTLMDNLIIPEEKIITVSDNYYLKDTITITETNNLNLIENGYIILLDNGKVVVNSFGPLARLKTTDNHPWIVWGEYTDDTPYCYKIYRKIGSNNWALLDTTSSLQYIDETVVTNDLISIGFVSYYIAANILEPKPMDINSDSITYSFSEIKQKKGNEASLRYENNLNQNYPNPFNATTKIVYSIVNDGRVTIKLYDVLGSEKATILDDHKTGGEYSIEFNANEYNLSSGVYFYTIDSGLFNKTKKMIILK
ncbi:MAG: T9SS type A sorting domain-containing protein [Syntrophothermus sp.]